MTISPYNKPKKRATMLSSLEFVDYVFISHSNTYSPSNLWKIKPNIFVMDSEKNKYKNRLILKKQIENKYKNIKVVILKYNNLISTTKLISWIKLWKQSTKTKPIKFIEILEKQKQFSTCALRQTSCLIVKNNKIISQWHNHSFWWFKCCRENCLRQKLKETWEYAKWIKLELCRAIHAEQDAICNAATNGMSTINAEIYCTDMPCIICAKLIVNCGIKKVYYINEYSNTQWYDFLTKNWINVEKIN